MSSPANITDTLKIFSSNITTSKVNERIHILENVKICISKSDMPVQATKGVLKILLFTLARYYDRKSRMSVEQLLKSLAKNEKYKNELAAVFCTIIQPHVSRLSKDTPSLLSSGTALILLRWTCIIIESLEITNENYDKLVDVLSQIYHVTILYGKKPTLDLSANNQIIRFLKNDVILVKFLDTIIELAKSNVCYLPMASEIIKYLNKTKKNGLINQYKTSLLDSFVKNVIASKVKLSSPFLDSCILLLSQVERDYFKESLLPALERAMLRNPEIVIPAIKVVLASMAIDLSSFSRDLSKQILTSCYSKDEQSCNYAVKALSSLSGQCSDSTALAALVKDTFLILNGKSGVKLTNLDQRSHLLEVITNCAQSAPISSFDLYEEVLECFTLYLSTEGNEATLILCIKSLSKWTSKLSHRVPDGLLPIFQKGLTLKSSTSSVILAYLQCMRATFRGDTVKFGLPLKQAFLSLMTKINVTQPVTIGQFINVFHMLLKFCSLDLELEQELKPMWSILTDSKTAYFSNEKYLQTTSEKDKQELSELCEKVLMNHCHRFKSDQLIQYQYALIYTLLNTKSFEAKLRLSILVRRILSQAGGDTLSLALIDVFATVLAKQKLPEADNDDNSVGIAHRQLYETLVTISSVSGVTQKSGNLIAMKLLSLMHHPCILSYNSEAWVDILSSLKIDAATFIEDKIHEIMSDLKNDSTQYTQQQCKMISTIVRISSNLALPSIMQLASSKLTDEELRSVTQSQVDVFRSDVKDRYQMIISKYVTNTSSTGNVKKVGKNYTYAEQMMDLELQKEQKKKRTAQPIKLGKKEQQAADEQVAADLIIRKQLLTINNSVCNACKIVESCLIGSPYEVPSELIHCEIIPSLRNLMNHPLLTDRKHGNHAKQTFASVCKLLIMGPISHLDTLVVEITETLVKCEKLDASLTIARYPNLMTQLIHLLAEVKRTVVIEHPTPMTAPGFSLLLYPLKCLLKSGGAIVNGDQNMMITSMRLLEVHATLIRGDDSQNCPSLLDREEMFRVCIDVIACNVDSIQQTGESALIATAACAGGRYGECHATQADRNILLDALKSPVSRLRDASLQSILEMSETLTKESFTDSDWLEFNHRITMAKHDVEDFISSLAEILWNKVGLTEDLDVLSLLCEEDVLAGENEPRQRCAARCIKSLLEYGQSNTSSKTAKGAQTGINSVLAILLSKYEDMLYMPPVELDKFGRPIEQVAIDKYASRVGIAFAFEAMATLFCNANILPLFNFLVTTGLNDRNTQVNKAMLTASVATLDLHGKENVSILLPIFEKFLEEAPRNKNYDDVRQSVVILMGSLARHLDKSDPRILPIVNKLIDALSTPSQQVQQAVASCLPALVPSIKPESPALIEKLMQSLLTSDNYAMRRGSAYGIAGIVKGLGIMSLKNLNIISRLTEAVQNKKSVKEREGALFAFELLCSTLGRLFEPYVVNILPFLLICFGDGNNYIRDAADATAKVVMSKLSAHGVKLVLPALLMALDQDSWRTKAGSVELLGTMAYCAPKQLSSCLPAIVPKLAEVLADSHNRVREAGAQALSQIGAVIRNPEIQAISSVLLAALQEPTPKRTQACLQKLLATKFVHFIDAPSLALIMPVVVRAFDSRTTDTRKMASQIIGNMYSLTDQKDLAPYLPQVIPGLKQSLLDPAPDVRTVSAAALGAMVRGMGDNGFQQLVPWLMETLVSESSSVDRSGAAQGLSEVVGGMGESKLDSLMPGIIETAGRSDIAPCVRDGYIMMFIYLPTTFGDQFSKYIARIIPCILKALADEAEFVRDTALRAGQRIVNLYAESAIQLLLPELENGLFHENWRIRFSSIQLVGDLLYRLSGVTGKMSTASTGDDDNFGSEMSQAAILKVLGKTRMNRVLAGLYMGRSDTALTVRTAALHVWKTIVSHTPKTLRDILPTLFGLLLGSLASQSYDKRQVAARTLGDIVRKLGEKVLPEIIPILEKGLESDESDQRQGVCIGLSEIMSSTSREHVQIYTDSLVSTVIKALLDPLPEVRRAAATTFDNLHSNVGARILDDILPKLLNKLNDADQCEYALDGLKQVMTVKSRVVLPMLVPHLIAPPMNTRAVSLLTSVAGSSLNPYLATILAALLAVVSDNLNTPNEAEEMKFAENVVLSVKTEEGVRILVNELLCSMNVPEIRYAAVMLLCEFAKSMPAASGQLDSHLTTIYRTIFRLYTVDDDERLLVAASTCLATIIKKLDTSDLISQITPIRQALRLLDFKGEELPGFCIAKKGIQPLLPVFREGILNGSPEVKENASLGITEMIEFTSSEALKPSVIHITGPSIRILGDKYVHTVKVALLDTMTLLLTKCAPSLKPFLPQLQTTFMKALNDPTRIVRIRSAAALCCLATIHQRVDPLVIELLGSAATTDDNDIRDTSLQALRGCIQSAGPRLSAKSVDEVFTTLTPLVESSSLSDVTRRIASACVGTLLPYLEPAVRTDYCITKLYDTNVNVEWTERLGYAIVLTIAMKQSASIFDSDDNAAFTLLANATSDRIPILLSSLNGIAYTLIHQMKNSLPINDKLLIALCKTMKHESNDVKQAGAQIAAHIATQCGVNIDEKVALAFIPMLVNGIREKRSTVKSWSETALVILLRLTEKTNDDMAFYNKCINNLEAGMADSLQDVYSKILKKVALKSEIDKIDDIDNTRLM